MRSLRLHLPAVIFLAGCILVWRAHSQVATALASPLEAVLPEFGEYTVAKQILSAEQERVAGMTDYVARVYGESGKVAFTTFVAYYDRQTSGKTIHSPRNCLPGAGWEIVSEGQRIVNAHGADRRVNRYILQNGGATALVYYWYQGRGRVTANEYTVKWNLLRDAAVTGRTEEALVRIVLPIRAASAADTSAAFAVADSVAAKVVARLMPDVQRVLPADRPLRSTS